MRELSPRQLQHLPSVPNSQFVKSDRVFLAGGDRGVAAWVAMLSRTDGLLPRFTKSNQIAINVAVLVLNSGRRKVMFSPRAMELSLTDGTTLTALEGEDWGGGFAWLGPSVVELNGEDVSELHLAQVILGAGDHCVCEVAFPMNKQYTESAAVRLCRSIRLPLDVGDRHSRVKLTLTGAPDSQSAAQVNVIEAQPPQRPRPAGRLSSAHAKLSPQEVDAFTLAAEEGDTKTLRRLLKVHPMLVYAGESQPGNRTALHFASASGQVGAVKLLISAGADVNARNTETGETALHYAAYEDKSAAAKVLLAAGADPNATDHSGVTPLGEAAIEGHRAMAALLLDKGAEVNARDASGSTPLTLAGPGLVADLLRARGGHE